MRDPIFWFGCQHKRVKVPQSRSASTFLKQARCSCFKSSAKTVVFSCWAELSKLSISHPNTLLLKDFQNFSRSRSLVQISLVRLCHWKPHLELQSRICQLEVAAVDPLPLRQRILMLVVAVITGRRSRTHLQNLSFRMPRVVIVINQRTPLFIV